MTCTQVLAQNTFTHIAGRIMFHSNLFLDHFRKMSKQASTLAMESMQMQTQHLMDKGTLFEGSILHIPATRFARSCLMEFFFLTCAEILRARLACHILTKSEHHTSSKNTLWEKLGCNKEATRVYIDSLIIHCYHNFKAKTIFSVCFIRQDNIYNIVSKYNERTSFATRI